MAYFGGVRTGGSPWSNYRKLSGLIKTLDWRHNTGAAGKSCAQIIKSSQTDLLLSVTLSSSFGLQLRRTVSVLKHDNNRDRESST